jgi:hypothetical protein
VLNGATKPISQKRSQASQTTTNGGQPPRRSSNPNHL